MKIILHIGSLSLIFFLFINGVCRPACEGAEKEACKRRDKLFLIWGLDSEQKRKNESREPEPNESFEQAVCTDFDKVISRYISNSDTHKDKDYYYVNLKSSKFKVMRAKEELTGISLKLYSNKQNRISVSPTSTLVELTSSTNGKKYQVLLEEYDAGTETFVYFAVEAPTKNSSVWYIPSNSTSSNPLPSNINADSFFSPDGNPQPYSYIFFQGDFTCSP